MDKVLLRPMFKKRYLQTYKIKTFNQGGIAEALPKFQTGGLSSRE